MKLGLTSLMVLGIAMGCSQGRPYPAEIRIPYSGTGTEFATLQFSGPQLALTLRVNQAAQPQFLGTNYLIRLFVQDGQPRTLQVAGTYIGFLATNDVTVEVDGRKESLLPAIRALVDQGERIIIEETRTRL